MGQSTHHRLDRLQIVSVGSLRDQSTTQFIVGGARRSGQANFRFSSLRSNHENAIELGRIFRGHTCGGPPCLDMRAPELHSGENLAGYR